MADRPLLVTRLSRAGLGLLLSTTCCVVQAQDSASEPLPHAEQLRLADGLFSRGLHELALEEYERLLNLDPAPAQIDLIAFRAGESARAVGDDFKAIPYYLRVVALGRDNETQYRARMRLAELTFQLNKPASTLAHTRAVLKSEAGKAFRTPALYLQGQAQAALKKPQEAVESFQQLIEESPNDPLAAYAALELARNEGDAEKKKAYFAAVVKEAGSPDLEMEAMWGLFRLAREQKELEEAARQGWALWQKHPDGARVRQALLTLAWTHLQVGQHARAFELSQAATPEQRKVQPDTWLYLDARSAAALSKPDVAVAALEEILEKYPTSRFRSLAAYELAALQAAKGKHEEVLKLRDELRGIPGRERDVDWLLAESARATGNVDEALKRYDALAALSPEDSPRVADATYLRAFLRDRKEDEGASAAYVEFVQRFPRDERAPAALHRAGGLSRRNADLSRAYTLWTRALEMYPTHPDNLEVRMQLAAMDAQANRTEDALKQYAAAKQGTEDAQRIAEIEYRMGLLYERTGKGEAAVAAYQKALPNTPKEQQVLLRLRLGVLLQNQEQNGEAVKVLKPLLADTPDALPDSTLLWLFRQAEDEKMELPIFGIASAMVEEDRNPTLRELGYYALARERTQQGDLKAAVADWEAGLNFGSKSRDAVQARLELGQLYLKLDQAQQAKDVYGRASAIASGLEDGRLQASAMLGVGDAEIALDQPEEAARMYLGVAVLYQDEEITPMALRKAEAAYREAGLNERADDILQQLGEDLPEQD